MSVASMQAIVRRRSQLLEERNDMLNEITATRNGLLRDAFWAAKRKDDVGAFLEEPRDEREEQERQRFVAEHQLGNDGSDTLDDWLNWDVPDLPPTPAPLTKEEDTPLTDSEDGSPPPTLEATAMETDEPVKTEAMEIDPPVSSIPLPPRAFDSEPLAINPQLLMLPENVIPAPMPPQPEYNIDADARPDPPTPFTLPELTSEYTRALTLPSVQSLPAEMNRKIHPSKAHRRREKEREKEGKELKGWMPMDMTRWHATILANPVAKMVRKAHKCLTTQEWKVAHREIVLGRAFEKMEMLRSAGRWSFRQPKRQKGPPLVKGHWGYLMDEMKWMQADFREERRWKIALAYEIALAVVEWHETEPEQRWQLCSGYVKPGENENVADRAELMEEDQMDSGISTMAQEGRRNEVEDNGGEDAEREDAESDDEAPAVRGDSEQNQPPQEANNQAVPTADVQGDVEAFIEEKEMKVEEQDTDLKMAEALDAENREASLAQVKADEDEAQERLDTPGKALKSGSQNPALTTEPDSLIAQPTVPPHKALRAPIVALGPEDLFFNLSEQVESLKLEDTDFVAPSIPSLFPELTVYVPLPTAPVPVDLTTTQKVEKRIDEAMSGRVVGGSSRFMDYKPLVVSALQPSRRWRGGQWTGFEENPVAAEEGMAPSDSAGCVLFASRKPPLSHPTMPSVPRAPSNAQQRLRETVWTAEEDSTLKAIVDKYPGNWSLISDLFNSSRVTIRTDRRGPWECHERWVRRWSPDGPEASAAIEAAGSPPPAGGSRKGIKRRADSVPNTAVEGETRKLKRHKYVNEVMKKSTKVRNQLQKQAPPPNKRVNMTAHDTHAAYTKVTYYTPAELSRAKVERDQKAALEQRQALERRQQELMRAAYLNQQQRQLQMQQLSQQQQQQQQQNAGQAPRQNQNGTQSPAQAVPQIRQLQHQQTIPNIAQQGTQLAAAQSQRVSTPLGVHRMSPTQQAMFQQQQQQQHAIAQQRAAQQQAQAAAAGGNGSASPAVGSQISPPRPPSSASMAQQARGSTSSPAVPHGSPPNGGNLSRPTSAQPNVQQMQSLGLMRANAGHLGSVPLPPPMTAEQMQQAIQMQQMIWQQQQAQLSHGQQPSSMAQQQGGAHPAAPHIPQ